MHFDPRSFIITSAFLGVLCAFVFLVLRRGFPREIRGIGHWGWSCLAMVASAFLFASHSYLPPVFSSLTANILLLSGVTLMHVGLRRFAGRPYSKARLGAGLLTVLAVLVWATLISDDYRVRVLIVAAFNSVLFTVCGGTVLRHCGRSVVEYLTAGLFVAMALISLIRMTEAVRQPESLSAVSDVSLIHTVYLGAFSFAILALSLCFMLMVGRRLQQQLERLASHDGLTGAYTRKAFFDLLTREITRSTRTGEPVALLMVDLDNFKSINDRYGHPTGDQVIIDFVRRTQESLRAHDVLGRYGGEEFAVLLPATTRDEACVVADRIRATFEQSATFGLPHYTVSIGVSHACNGRAEVGEFLDLADRALYRAKQCGKNRVEMAA